MKILGLLRPLTIKKYFVDLHHRIRWLFIFSQWRKKAFAEIVIPSSSPDTVAIIFSHQQPQNLSTIVRTLLLTPSIAKIIIIYNNPAIRLSSFFVSEDPRITVIQNVIRKHSSLRYWIAAREKSYQKFLSFDDDIFLKPTQLEMLCSSLRIDPSSPFGISGEVYDSWRGMVYHNMNSRSQKIDALHRVYAFTSEHLEAFFRLVSETSFRPTHHLWNAVDWDRFFLSFCTKKPQAVYVGSYLNYPSQRAPTNFRSPSTDIYKARLLILLMLRKIRLQRC